MLRKFFFVWDRYALKRTESYQIDVSMDNMEGLRKKKARKRIAVLGYLSIFCDEVLEL